MKITIIATGFENEKEPFASEISETPVKKVEPVKVERRAAPVVEEKPAPIVVESDDDLDDIYDIFKSKEKEAPEAPEYSANSYKNILGY